MGNGVYFNFFGPEGLQTEKEILEELGPYKVICFRLTVHAYCFIAKKKVAPVRKRGSKDFRCEAKAGKVNKISYTLSVVH